MLTIGWSNVLLTDTAIVQPMSKHVLTIGVSNVLLIDTCIVQHMQRHMLTIGWTNMLPMVECASQLVSLWKCCIRVARHGDGILRALTEEMQGRDISILEKIERDGNIEKVTRKGRDM